MPLNDLIPRNHLGIQTPWIGQDAPTLPAMAPMAAASLPVLSAGPMPSVIPQSAADITVNPPSLTDQRILQSKSKLNDLINPGPSLGQPGSTHPGILGKIGHIAGAIGNIAGNIVAPETMALIPGTSLNKHLQIEQEQNRLDRAEAVKSTEEGQAQTEANTEYTQARPDIEKAKIQQKMDVANNKNAAMLKTKGIIYKVDPDTGIPDIQEDPNSQAYKDQVALANMHQSTSDFDNIKAENADNRYKPGTPQYTEWYQKLMNAQKQMQVHMASLGLSRERLNFQQDKFYNPQPTGTERNKADLASSAETQLGDLASIIQKHRDMFGPGYGQSTAFKKWLGSEDPDAQRFIAARTIAGDHLAGTFGGRSEAALTALDNAIGQFKDNPDAALAGIDQLKGANSTFITAGQVHAKGGKLKPTQASQPGANVKVKKFNPTTGRLE